MARRTSSVRAAAVRRAQEAKARRDAERLQRERRIEAALADFYESTATAEQLRATARDKAARIIEDGEAVARESDAAARAAVRQLRELVDTHAEVADLCGVPMATVRAMLTDMAASASPDRDSTQGRAA